MNNRSQVLYTIYRNSDDELIAFEEPADKCAKLMGIKRDTLYQIISRNTGKYTIFKKQK